MATKGATTYNYTDTRFLSALAGGFLVGWRAMIWRISIWICDHAPEAIRKTVLTGILAWFFLDSSSSVASENTLNVLFNAIILFIAVGPLWWPAKQA